MKFLFSDTRFHGLQKTALEHSSKQGKGSTFCTLLVGEQCPQAPFYYAVGYWNDWFSAFLYLNNPKLYPLQLVLRSILVSNTIDDSLVIDPNTRMKMMGMAEMLKYSLIVVSTVPLLCIYPLVQKYFIRGVMIGSLKG